MDVGIEHRVNVEDVEIGECRRHVRGQRRQRIRCVDADTPHAAITAPAISHRRPERHDEHRQHREVGRTLDHGVSPMTNAPVPSVR